MIASNLWIHGGRLRGVVGAFAGRAVDMDWAGWLMSL
jgi:hypothetical protein